MKLYNTFSAEERAKIIDDSQLEYITLSFYRYAHINDAQTFRDEIFVGWNILDILGRVYVSKEGINTQMISPFSLQAKCSLKP